MCNRKYTSLIIMSHITIYPGNASFGSSGGRGSITVSADSGVSWKVSDSLNWVSIDKTNGTGNGIINYSVSSNYQQRHGKKITGGIKRSGNLVFSELTFVKQSTKQVPILDSNTIYVDAIFGNDQTAKRGPLTPWRTLTGATISAKSGDAIYLKSGNIIADNCIIPFGVNVHGEGSSVVKLIPEHYSFTGPNRFFSSGDNIFSDFSSELAYQPLNAKNLSFFNINFAQRQLQDAIHGYIPTGAHWYLENVNAKAGYDTFNVNGPLIGDNLGLVEMDNCNFQVTYDPYANSQGYGRAINVINYDLKMYGGSVSCVNYSGADAFNAPCGFCISVWDSKSKVQLWDTRLYYPSVNGVEYPIVYVPDDLSAYGLSSGNPNGNNVSYYGVPNFNTGNVYGGTLEVIDTSHDIYNFPITQL